MDVVGFHVSNISIVLVVAIFVNCVALNIPIRFAEVGVAGMVGLLEILVIPDTAFTKQSRFIKDSS